MRPSRRTARTVVLRICALFPLSDLSSNFSGDCNGYAMNRTIASACESCQETRPRALFNANWGVGSGIADCGLRIADCGLRIDKTFRLDFTSTVEQAHKSAIRNPTPPMSVMHHWHSAYSLSLRDPEVDSQNRLRYFARLQARRHSVAS